MILFGETGLSRGASGAMVNPHLRLKAFCIRTEMGVSPRVRIGGYGTRFDDASDR